MKYQYSISTLLVNIGTSYLFMQDIPAPKQSFEEGSKVYELGNGGALTAGFPIITWGWASLTKEQVAIFRALCPNGSTELYIRSLDDALAWQTFHVIMTWPIGAPDIMLDSTIGFILRFKVLEVVIAYP